MTYLFNFFEKMVVVSTFIDMKCFILASSFFFIPDTSLDKVLDDKYLLDLAGQLGSEWEQLGTYLEFDSSEIFRIKAENQSNMLTGIHRMLISWRQRQDPEHGVKQVLENLSQALGSCKRKDLAQKVLHLIPNKP